MAKQKQTKNKSALQKKVDQLKTGIKKKDDQIALLKVILKEIRKFKEKKHKKVEAAELKELEESMA